MSGDGQNSEEAQMKDEPEITSSTEATEATEGPTRKLSMEEEFTL